MAYFEKFHHSRHNQAILAQHMTIGDNMGNTNADKALGLAAADEVREWQDALSAVIQHAGPERAHALLEELLEHARQHSIDMPFSATTGYVNTIEPEEEERSPGNLELEGRLRAYMRWNA